MGIDNTARRMEEDPIYRALIFDGTGNPGGRPGMIEQQERDGQRQLVGSDRLPVRLVLGSREDFEALGFTFGDPDPGDPLFRPATLPEGWKREGSDHAMWSYILDRHGRRRVAIFFKNAWYDRKAFMRLQTIYSYASEYADGNAPLVLDDWATREGMLEALREEAEDWRGYAAGAEERGSKKTAEDDRAYAAKYEAAIARLEAEAASAPEGAES